jgi:hypothetical protein
MAFDNMSSRIRDSDLKTFFARSTPTVVASMSGLFLLGIADAAHPAWRIDAVLLRQEEAISSLEHSRER